MLRVLIALSQGHEHAYRRTPLVLLRAPASGDVAAAPPRSVMNERRFMASIRDLIPEEMDHAPVE